MKSRILFVSVLILGVLLSISPSLAQTNETNQTATPTVTATVTATPTATATPAQTTAAPTAAVTTAAPTAVATTVPSTPAAPGKFRVAPSVRLRPVIDVIEAEQDGIVELFMDNPSLNDVTLHVDANINVPAGFHVYGENFGQAGAAGTVYGVFDVPPGTGRTIRMHIKADKSAKLGSHIVDFAGTYWPGDNKDNYQQVTLSYSVTVKEPSKKPEEPPKEVATTTAAKTPGFAAILALVSILAIARLLSRKV